MFKEFLGTIFICHGGGPLEKASLSSETLLCLTSIVEGDVIRVSASSKS